MLSHEEMLSNVCGDDFVEDMSNTVWSHIIRLKRKLSIAKDALKFVDNIYSVGYRFYI